MTTSLGDLLAAVPALNSADNAFTYEVKGDTIVGTWNIVSAAFIGMDGAGGIDKKYTLTVSLNDKKKQYDFDEKKRDSEVSATVDDGKLKLGASTSAFKGKSSSKEFSFSFGNANVTKDGVSPVLAYSFETKLIKKPLFDFLQANGWERKKGFLGGLFRN
jgi:hypothetical protein